ncbi:MAG: tetratricopeptide repeat protein [Ardenticatenales bacterium]|nr:tetratricopeptide repeat protein [Ardenticatenales bacterium]
MSDTQVRELMAIALWGTPADTKSGTYVSSGDVRRDWQRVLDEISAQLKNADLREHAQLCHRLGHMALITGNVRMKAKEAFTLMVEDARALGDKVLEGLALHGLAKVYDLIGQRLLSLECAEQAQQLAEETNDRRLLALALHVQAQFHKETGDNRLAYDLWERIETIGHELNDEGLIMGGLVGKGCASSMAEAFAAMSYHEQAIEMAKSQNDARMLAICYNNLADWKINTGAYEEAQVLREQSLAIFRSIGSRLGVGRALIGLAKAETILGNLERARELLDQGVPMALSAGDVEGDLHSSLNLAYLYLAAGEIARAAQLYREVLDRSLAAPDHACSLFAQRALNLIADGKRPTPGILPLVPITRELLMNLENGLTPDELTEEELEFVIGGGLNYTFGTNHISDFVM